MHKQDFKPLLDRVSNELKEIEAARRAAHQAARALRKKMEGAEDDADEKKQQQLEEAASEWRQLEASLRGLQDSALALSRSVRERGEHLPASPASREPEGQGRDGGGDIGWEDKGRKPNPAGGEKNQTAYTQMFMINESQIRIISAIDGLKRHVTETASLQDRWLLALAAGVILNLALAMGLLFRWADGITPAIEGNNPPAVAETAVEPLEEAEEAGKINAAATLTTGKEPPASAAPPAGLLSPETAEALIGPRAGYALIYLKKKEFGRLASRYFHPEKGIYFLPFGLKAAGRRFSAGEAEEAVAGSAVYHWGVAEAAPIEMDFENYYLRFIFDVDFSEGSEKHYNELHFPGSSGLSVRQLATRFPDCAFAEFHKAGSSLILVFEKWGQDNTWYLSAAIHNK